MSGSKVPRIQLTNEHRTGRGSSGPFEPLYSLARFLRESLRVHNVRRQRNRRLRQSKQNWLAVGATGQRTRSKSVGHDERPEVDLEEGNLTDVGFSAVVASDCGPVVAVEAVQQEQAVGREPARHRRLSISVGENELQHWHKLTATDSRPPRLSSPARQCSVPSNAGRRPSKDDSALDHNRNSLRGHFVRLMESIRASKLECSSPPPRVPAGPIRRPASSSSSSD